MHLCGWGCPGCVGNVPVIAGQVEGGPCEVKQLVLEVLCSDAKVREKEIPHLWALNRMDFDPVYDQLDEMGLQRLLSRHF